jgi:GH43 family beta-xylosidase
MFENPGLLLSMNMAKWQIWLACYSDLCVYLGGLVFHRVDTTSDDVANLLTGVFDRSMDTLGTPEDAAPEFEANVEETRQRIANTDYSTISDDETAFTRSPEALYKWAPIDDELKARDKIIVKNSIRFRWQEIRRSARSVLDAEGLTGKPASPS